MKNLAPAFPAPADIELAIVNFGYEVLDLQLGDFWYKWFVSNNPTNKTLHFMTNKKFNEGFLRDELAKLPELKIVKVFKITFIDFTKIAPYEEFKYMYHIHFKTEE